ncbi:MAG TPA: TraB/GumN family protein [Oligoflexia bacterium]|nr:TraB/GumN family protein [Oligoflexia bacterium]
MKNITELEPGLTLVETAAQQIYLLGTAHVSQASADLVRRSIAELRPDIVCVELCQARAQNMLNPERWRETDIFALLLQGKAYVLLAQLLLSSFQRRIAKQLDIRPGEEMLAAMHAAHDARIPVETVDRDVKLTLRRIWAKASLWSMLNVAAAIITSLFSHEEVTESQIEELKTGDALTEILSEFAQYLPGVKTVLIDERDRYMAARITASRGKRILAVAGAGHIPGIKAQIGEKVDLAELEKVPPPSKLWTAAGWSIPVLIIGLLVYGFFAAGTGTSMRMAGLWAAATGGLASLGALLSLAHPLTVLCALVSAPVTCLHPTLAVGWICALVEAFLRKPRVRDLENLAQDSMTVRGFWQNRVSKVLLVLALTNIGGALGAVVGGILAASALR